MKMTIASQEIFVTLICTTFKLLQCGDDGCTPLATTGSYFGTNLETNQRMEICLIF